MTTAAERPLSNCPTVRYGIDFDAPSVPGTSKTVALTFDDGPGASTARILSILESYGVRATFFNIGEQEARWPGDVKAEEAAGFLVANHTWNHPDLVGLSPAGQAAEMDEVIDEQESLVGTAPCELRPPYGDYDATTLNIARARRMSVWLWNVDTEDWEADGSGSSYWVTRIISLAESEGGSLDHPVILMHNQEIPMPATVAALPVIITFFETHGYTFVDLLGRTGPPAGCGGVAKHYSAPGTAVQPGTVLPSGAHVSSPGGQYLLGMSANGDLVLSTASGRVLWTSRTGRWHGAVAHMQADGNFVIDADGKVVWSTGTGGHPGAVLEVGADARIAVVFHGRSLWTSSSGNSVLAPGERLRTGWYLSSPETSCHLLMRRDGNLVLYSSTGRTIWASATRGHPGADAVMEPDGNLVVYSSSGVELWSTRSAGHRGASLFVDRIGSAFIETASGHMPWLSR